MTGERIKKLRKEKNVKKETAHENAINVNSIKKSISGKEKVKSEKVEKKSKIRWLWLLNPNNLAKEIHVYGYDFSWLTHAFFIIGSVIGISAIGLLYKLRPEYLIIAIIVAVALRCVSNRSTNRCLNKKGLQMYWNIWIRCYIHFRKQGKYCLHYRKHEKVLKKEI